MEPDWTKKIPSWAVCDWFYMFFVVNVFVVCILVLSVIYLAFTSVVPRAIKPFHVFMVLLQMIVSGTSTLFFYLMCDRSLRPSS